MAGLLKVQAGEIQHKILSPPQLCTFSFEFKFEIDLHIFVAPVRICVIQSAVLFCRSFSQFVDRYFVDKIYRLFSTTKKAHLTPKTKC